jgi:hypothetical protein
MAVFMDTGGDIYAAETKEECLNAIKADIGEKEFAKIEDEIFEVGGDEPIQCEEEDGSPGTTSTTLQEEYTNIGHGYCIASSNC